MEPLEPVFPVKYCRRVRVRALSRETKVVEETYDTIEELEQDLEWIDTRGDSDTWFVDALDRTFDFKLNWLRGEATEFFQRLVKPT